VVAVQEKSVTLQQSWDALAENEGFLDVFHAAMGGAATLQTEYHDESNDAKEYLV